MATYDRPDVLRRTLDSIFVQRPLFEFEVIVVDDGGQHSAEGVCSRYPVRYSRVEREPGYRNPAVARNMSYKTAMGDVLICQSDDVMHRGGVIERLAEDLREGEFLIATVWNVDEAGRHKGLDLWPSIKQLTGLHNRRPLFFLGSCWREDMYAIGGNDEGFTDPGREDQWLADCLIHGRGLQPRYIAVEGHHQDHPRPEGLHEAYQRSARLYRERASQALRFRAWRGGEPWPYP